jgi:hypothetical protein
MGGGAIVCRMASKMPGRNRQVLGEGHLGSSGGIIYQ